MSFLKKEVETTSDEMPQKTFGQRFFCEFRDYLFIFATFMVIFVLLFRVVVVDGRSMNATLVDGDRLILISRVLYHTPKQGDIIVASKDSFRDGENIVKRVIATSGQTVDIDFEKRLVYVDGKVLDEDYAYFAEGDTSAMMQEGVSFPLTVEEGCVFVMGDNRNNSKDSRNPQIGLIDEREILGKVVFLIWPGTNKGELTADYSRIGVIS